jgi:DNA polymerase III subunit beta
MTMHLKMDRENLLKAVGRTLGVVDRRGPMVILSHFLLEAKDDQVAVAATDLEVSFKGFSRPRSWSPGP